MEDLVQHLVNGISLGSIYALIALGYTMVYGVLQMINFAHSEIYMMGAFSAFYFARWTNLEMRPGFLSFIYILLAAMICCSALGLLIERFAYRPLRNSPKLNILITAIGVSLFLQYLGQIVFGASPQVFPTVLDDSILFTMGEVEVRVIDVTILGVAMFFMISLHFFIFHTRLGKAMRAVSQNARVAALMGISPNRIIMMTFAIGSSLAGVASVLVGVKYPKIDPMMGTLIGIKAFVAAVLGGIGNIMGAVMGGLLLGVCEEFVVAFLSSTYRDALAFGILVLILLFRPAGLLGRVQQEKV